MIMITCLKLMATLCALTTRPVFASSPFEANLLEVNKFRVPKNFCELQGGDPLGLQNTSHERNKMHTHGGAACKFLPFREQNHSKIPFSLIYRHLPKGGSSTVGQLLNEMWASAWVNEDRRPNIKHLERVHNCMDPQLEAARKDGHALEFAVAREPLSRFVSGYFYTNTQFIMNKTTGIKEDGGRKQLVQYLSTLPDGIDNVHLFPEYLFFCSCGKLSSSSGLSSACAHSVRFILRLEHIQSDWSEFAHAASGGFIKPRVKAAPQVNVNKKSLFNASDSGFEAFNVHDADHSDIVSPLCRYLANDYSALRALYTPPKECKYPLG